MYGLMRRRSMMTMALPVPTERLIYSLTDYTCDGTINTFIDTGIKLFGYEYDSFRIEMEYDGLDLTTANLETLLECKSFIPIGPGSTLTSGLAVRVNNRSQYSPQYEALGVSFRPLRETDAYFENTSSANLSIVYNKQNNSITVNGEAVNFSGALLYNEPLTIGGRYSSHLSNPDRFVQVHISSLKIYAIANENYQYIFTPLTFKCLTGGDLSIKNTNGSYDRNFEYSLNGGAWTEFDLPKNTASKLIATLSPNDTISFRRDNDNFADAQFISDSNLTFDIYGNLLSLQYGSAFSGQTDLRNTAKKAFGGIFNGTNVVDASKLMLTASTLSNNCYDNMFSGCSNLISAPCILPAMNVPSYAYSSMFENCSSLSKAPIIWASNIAGRAACYCMFQNCTSLVTIPEFEINSIGDIESCYKMFEGCRSLTTIPKLNATTLKNKCYQNMFSGCISLTTAPELPATTLAKSCYQSMFEGCTSLTTAPELSATTMAESCYDGMFNNTALTVAPELPATTLAKNCYQNMFMNCTNLVTVHELPVTTLAESCYSQMFYGCASLTIAPSLPATVLSNNCYTSMFRNCTSLLAAPELPAKTLVSGCYSWMFDGCSQLSYVKCLATDGMIYNNIAQWLRKVSNTGTFVKASGVTWPSGSNGIPNGWTVIEE